MISPHLPFSFLLSAALVFPGSPVRGENEGEGEGTAELKRALQVVQEYIAAEQSTAGERVASRSGMLEFRFKSTRENGRYQMLSESAWRKWELDRAEDRTVQHLQVIGEPQVENIGKDLFRVSCALHLNVIEDGKNWEGVSLRSFEVRLDEEGPRIRHERLLANREGIKPGRWEKLAKKRSEGRSNLRSSPSTSKDNVIGKVESEEVLDVWNQEDEPWVLVRKADGLVGFIHRSQIDFENRPPAESGESEGAGEGSGGALPKEKVHPFGVVLPGKPGYVLNPYTNSIVDVRGLKAGTLVRDPRDPVPDRAFRVPIEGRPSRAIIVEE